MGAAGVATAARVTSSDGSDGSEEREVVDILLRGWPVPFAARRFTPVCRRDLSICSHVPNCFLARVFWCATRCKACGLERGDTSFRGQGFRGQQIRAIRGFIASRPFFIFWERSCEPPRTA